MKTVNQLLDIIDGLTIDEMFPKLNEVRNELKALKNQHPKGGLNPVKNTAQVLKLVARAQEKQVEKAVLEAIY